MVQGEVLLVLFRHRAIDLVGALAPRIQLHLPVMLQCRLHAIWEGSAALVGVTVASNECNHVRR